MTILYDFFNVPGDKLYMDIWLEKPEETEFLWSVPVENIGHGFQVLEKYREEGYKVKSGF